MLLDRRANVAQTIADQRLIERPPQTGFGHFEQPSGLGLDLSHRVGPGRVADEPIQHRSDVDADDISFAQPCRSRDTVYDHLVERGAYGAGKRRRGTAMV